MKLPDPLTVPITFLCSECGAEFAGTLTIYLRPMLDGLLIEYRIVNAVGHCGHTTRIPVSLTSNEIVLEAA